MPCGRAQTREDPRSDQGTCKYHREMRRRTAVRRSTHTAALAVLLAVVVLAAVAPAPAAPLPKVTMIGDSVSGAIAYEKVALATLRRGADVDLQLAPCRRVGTDELPLQGHDGADRARAARHARVEARGQHGHRRGRLQRLRAGVCRQHRGRAHCDAQPGREARCVGDAACRAAVVPCDERHDQGGGGSPPRDDGRGLEPLLAQPPRLVPARRPAPRLAGSAGDGDASAHHTDGARDRRRAGSEAEGRGVHRGRRKGG